MNLMTTKIFTALGVILLGGFLLVLFGQSKHREGYSKCQAEISQQEQEKAHAAAKEYERSEKYAQDTADVDLDNVLIELGLMRQNP